MTVAVSAERLTLVADPTPEQIDEVCRLRVEAWRGRANVFPGTSEWRDAWEDRSHHRLMLIDTGCIVGALRFSMHTDLDDLPDGGVWADRSLSLPRPLAYFSRMFIAFDWQGEGLSHLLDRAAIDEPRRAGAASIVCMTGSVARNRRRARRLVDLGWSRLGPASGSSPDAIFKATHVPDVFAIRFDGAANA